VLSGPIGANMKPIADGVRVWVRWINDRGGINGHPVTLIQGDSGADPARHRALVQQFVEQKKVVAFVGQPGDVFSGAGSVEYLTKAGVPVVGSEGGANWYYESPVYFPQMVHGRVLVQALALGTSSEMRRRQQSKLALWTCVEAQTCSDIAEVFPKVVPRNGVSVVQQSKISIGQPDFTAECLNGRNAGAQTIIVSADGATISRAAASCARQGYRPSWGFFGAQILAKQHAEDPNLNDALVLDLTAPWFLTDTPARKEFVDAAARYAPTLPTGSPMANGWVAGKVFEYAAVRAAEPLSKATILSALAAVRGDVLPDLTGPLLFSPDRPATPSACLWVETLRGGRWASPDNGQRHCYDYDPTI
jgi:branched-chain amino acid transport system substrate-binding protein